MSKRKKGGAVGRFFRRVLLLIVTGAVLMALGAYTLLGTVFNGPSQIARKELTLSLMADPATDWIPGLFLDEELIGQICE